jgi:predicted Rossmann fold flavoprotein
VSGTSSPSDLSDLVDVVIVGAGAAGLATAIFIGRANPTLRVVVVEGARSPGAKILVSGGGRCNVTNADATEADFNTGSPAIVRRVLRRWPTRATIEFFHGLGVPLHEEPLGKFFPDSGRARDVLNALLGEVRRVGARLRAATRVRALRASAEGFVLETSSGALRVATVVMATGGLSLPKTGSDGWGLVAVRDLGHSIVPTTPALAPITLRGGPGAIHAALAGVGVPARLDLASAETSATRVRGSLLWTHFGVSGPAALDLSRHWLRADLEARPVALTASFCPSETFESVEARWTALARARPRASFATALAEFVPASMAAAMLDATVLAADRTLATLSRDDRRRLVHALTAWPLEATGSRGYAYAEVTAGGVPLQEIHPESMASRLVPGLYLVGEILDVDGRLGGFNFQWAWASAKVAGDAIAARSLG